MSILHVLPQDREGLIGSKFCLNFAKEIGQLLEYAYWPAVMRANELVIVGEPTIDPNAAAYLEFLRRRFNLSIYYRSLDETARTLGPKV